MSKKIAFYIAGKEFNVDVDEIFAEYLQKQMSQDFDSKNDLKALVHGYVKKNHELFIQDLEMQKLIEKLTKAS